MANIMFNHTDDNSVFSCIIYFRFNHDKSPLVHDNLQLTLFQSLIHLINRTLFDYCSLIWMFCGRTLREKINTLHERALRLAYNDYTSSFNALLDKDSSVTMHQRNLRCLAIEIFIEIRPTKSLPTIHL